MAVTVFNICDAENNSTNRTFSNDDSDYGITLSNRTINKYHMNKRVMVIMKMIHQMIRVKRENVRIVSITIAAPRSIQITVTFIAIVIMIMAVVMSVWQS